MVMIQTKNERYLKGVYKKFHSKSAGSYFHLRRISSNAYVLDVPEHMGISNLFNIEDLTLCQVHDEDEPNDAIVVKLPPASCVKGEIEDVINSSLLVEVAIKGISSNEMGVYFCIVLGSLILSSNASPRLHALNSSTSEFSQTGER
jgi:hypothetical protein